MNAIDAQSEWSLRTWADVVDPGRELDPDQRTLMAARIRAHWVSAMASAASARRWRERRTRELDRAEGPGTARPAA